MNFLGEAGISTLFFYDFYLVFLIENFQYLRSMRTFRYSAQNVTRPKAIETIQTLEIASKLMRLMAAGSVGGELRNE